MLKFFSLSNELSVPHLCYNILVKIYVLSPSGSEIWELVYFGAIVLRKLSPSNVLFFIALKIFESVALVVCVKAIFFFQLQNLLVFTTFFFDIQSFEDADV